MSTVIRSSLCLLLLTGLFNQTFAQISLVKEFGCSVNPNAFTRFNNQLYFNTNSGCGANGIYRTDGTAAGTVFVSTDVFDQNPTGRCVAGGHLYFGTLAGQLKRINGQTGAVELVKSGFSGVPRYMAEVSGGILLFTDNGTGLWRSDGTTAGTYAIRSELTSIGQVVSDGTTAYFQATGDASLYKTDGTAAGTLVLLNTGGAGIRGLTIWNGLPYFCRNLPDGTAQIIKWTGTNFVVLTSIAQSPTTNSTPFNDVERFIPTATALYFFGASVSNTGKKIDQLWKTDGTQAGTGLVTIMEGAVPGYFRTRQVNPEGYQTILYFPADDATYGTELWRSDGTAGGTFRVRDINPGATGSTPLDFACINGICYFHAYTETTGNEIWRSDGSSAGTQLVQDLWPGPNGGSAAVNTGNSGLSYYSMVYNGRLYFRGQSADGNSQLYKTCAVPGPPTLTASPGASVCAGTSVTLTASGCTGSVTWNTGATGASLILTPSAGTADYFATCTAESCTSPNSTTLTLLATSPPGAPTISPAGAVSFCLGQTTSLTASGCSGQVRWNTGATGNLLSVSAAGSYSASCTVNNCTGPGSAVVQATAVSTSATVSLSPPLICAGSPQTLTATPTNGGSTPAYQWMRNNVPILNVTNRTATNGLGSANALGVYVAANGTVYASTTNGLSISTDGGQTFVNRTTANGLGSNFALNAFVGVDGKLYAATSAGLGISSDGGNSFSNKISNRTVNSVYVDGTGKLYAATGGNTAAGLGISTDGGNTFTYKTTANGLGGVTVIGVTAGSDGKIYAATYGGLSSSTDGGNTFSNKTVANGLGDNVCNEVAVSSDGRIYVATNGGLSISTNGGTSFVNRTTADGLGNNVVEAVFVDATGTVYAGSSGGLSISTNGGQTFVNYTAASGLGATYVQGIHVTPDKTIYLATSSSPASGISIAQRPANTYPVQTATAGDVYSVSLSPSADACPALALVSASVVITASPSSPTLTASPSATLCAGASVTLTATGCAGTVTWNTGATGSSLAVAPAATATYTVTCTQNGCPSGPGSIELTVKPVPIAPVIKASICTEAGATKVWDRRFGGTNNDYFINAVVAPSGNYLLGGTSRSNQSGDRSQPLQGVDDQDYWVVMVDSDGNKLWDRRFGGTGEEIFGRLIATSDGNFLLAGHTDSGQNGDKSQPSQGLYDYWIIKIDGSGNKLWDKRFGGLGNDKLTAVIATSDGGYLLGGESASGQNGDISQPSRGNIDFWIIKVDANGTKQWDKRFGGAAGESIGDMVSTIDGGYLLGGYSFSGNDGDKAQSSQGFADYWIVKIDATGTKLWDRRFGGASYDYLTSLLAQADGSYLLGGYSQSGQGGDKSQPSQGGFDFWVVKIDAAGTKLWDKRFGGTGNNDWLSSMVAVTDNNVLLAGKSSSGQNGDKSQPSRGLTDYWIVKIDVNGNKIWDRGFGGNNDDNLKNIILTPDGSYLLGGESASGQTGDKSQPSQGNLDYLDYWIMKVAECSELTGGICAGQPVTLRATGCAGVITWSTGATGNQLSVSPGQSTSYSATCTLNGCSSVASSPVMITVYPENTTVKTGNWNDATVWSCGRVPTTADAVTLNHAITIPASFAATALRVRYGAGGQLRPLLGGRLRAYP
ncbi:ELWxxDGT repeat protein [Fibrella arboris]|uniref:ELWxxDGT repeat protein n=1 Tax=Fibrella arboris TaxID=3242486 RepID=UPI0035208A97